MTRQTFRRQLKQDQRKIAEGISVDGFDGAGFVSLMRVFREKLRISVDRGSITPLMHFAYESFELSASKIPSEALACRKGCSHCCNIWTDAYAPEIFYLAKASARLPHDGVAEAIQNIGEFASSVSFDQRDTLPIPCPLLVDHSCSAYSTRPLNCRTAVSMDESACRRAFIDGEEIDIPVQPAWSSLGQAYSLALKGALVHAGLDYEAYELSSALKQCSDIPDLEESWLRGEAVFSCAKTREPAPPFTHPFWKSLYLEAFAG